MSFSFFFLRQLCHGRADKGRRRRCCRKRSLQPPQLIAVRRLQVCKELAASEDVRGVLERLEVCAVAFVRTHDAEKPLAYPRTRSADVGRSRKDTAQSNRVPARGASGSLLLTCSTGPECLDST